jgi:hypothetical protein
MPMPPARKSAGRFAFWCSVNDPKGPSIAISVPAAASIRLRLNALPVNRVANMMRGRSAGDDVMEKVLVVPSASS